MHSEQGNTLLPAIIFSPDTSRSMTLALRLHLSLLLRQATQLTAGLPVFRLVLDIVGSRACIGAETSRRFLTVLLELTGGGNVNMSATDKTVPYAGQATGISDGMGGDAKPQHRQTSNGRRQGLHSA